MTSQELYDNFLLQYDVNGSFSAAGFTDDEIFMFLTKAQLEVMNAISDGRTNNLQELLHGTVITAEASTAYNVNNIKVLSTFESVFKMINGTASVKKMEAGNINPVTDSYISLPLKQIDEALIGNLFESAYNKPIFDWVYYFINNDNMYLLHDSYTSDIASVALSYIKMPSDITSTVTASLNPKYHKDIVDSAVVIALNTVNDIRTKKAN